MVQRDAPPQHCRNATRTFLDIDNGSEHTVRSKLFRNITGEPMCSEYTVSLNVALDSKSIVIQQCKPVKSRPSFLAAPHCSAMAGYQPVADRIQKRNPRQVVTHCRRKYTSVFLSWSV